MSDEPTKAYLVSYAIVNEMEGIVYANSAQDALDRFERHEVEVNHTGIDWRLRKPTAKRFPQDDR